MPLEGKELVIMKIEPVNLNHMKKADHKINNISKFYKPKEFFSKIIQTIKPFVMSVNLFLLLP